MMFNFSKLGIILHGLAFLVHGAALKASGVEKT